MSHNFAKIAVTVSAAVTLTGCSQLGTLGNSVWGHTQNAWGYTKSAANFVASPVTKLLRSAPEQNYVFDNRYNSQQAVRNAFAADGQLYNPRELVHPRGELVVPQLAQLPVPQTPNYQNPVYPPQTYQSVYGNPPAQAKRVVEARPMAPLITPRVTQDISFVKMGGGSNMQDWVTCEAQAGGFVQVLQEGYLIEPRFESCMRAKGYKPESEVADQLSL